MSDLDIGDMGAVDEFGLPIEVPVPQLADDQEMSMLSGGPGAAFTASLAEAGLAASAAPVTVEDGLGMAFGAGLDIAAFSGEQLGSVPQFEAPLPDAAGGAFVPDALPVPAPIPVAPAGETSFSDAPFASEAQGVTIGGLPDFELPAVSDFMASGGTPVQDAQGFALGSLPFLEPPPAPDLTFSPVTMGAPEVLDLQMALSPPEPSQEGFGSVSDAPMPPPASLSPISVGEHSTSAMLAMSEAISERVWGSSSLNAGDGVRGAPVGASVRIENLHLQADNSNEFLDQLIGSCPELTNSNLSALEG